MIIIAKNYRQAIINNYTAAFGGSWIEFIKAVKNKMLTTPIHNLAGIKMSDRKSNAPEWLINTSWSYCLRDILEYINGILGPFDGFCSPITYEGANALFNINFGYLSQSKKENYIKTFIYMIQSLDEKLIHCQIDTEIRDTTSEQDNAIPENNTKSLGV